MITNLVLIRSVDTLKMCLINQRLRDKNPLSQKLIVRNARFHEFCTAKLCLKSDVFGTVDTMSRKLMLLIVIKIMGIAHVALYLLKNARSLKILILYSNRANQKPYPQFHLTKVHEKLLMA